MTVKCWESGSLDLFPALTEECILVVEVVVMDSIAKQTYLAHAFWKAAWLSGWDLDLYIRDTSPEGTLWDLSFTLFVKWLSDTSDWESHGHHLSPFPIPTVRVRRRRTKELLLQERKNVCCRLPSAILEPHSSSSSQEGRAAAQKKAQPRKERRVKNNEVPEMPEQISKGPWLPARDWRCQWRTKDSSFFPHRWLLDLH